MFITHNIRLVCLSICCFIVFNSNANELRKNIFERKEMKHTKPQEPLPPFPYSVKEVAYNNEKADITIAGTLTTPNTKGPFSAVILIAGMGAADRDKTMFGHKPYLVLADYLTRRGIAVLRIDKRGVGGSSGTFDMNVTSRDLANDVLAGIKYLKTQNNIDHTRIGLIGSSEGGMIASLLASESNNVAFIVSMAGAVGNNPKLLAQQIARQLSYDGASEALIINTQSIIQELLTIVRDEPNSKIAEKKLNEFVTKQLNSLSKAILNEAKKYPFAVSEENASSMIKVYNSPWYRWILAQNMDHILSNIYVPMLAMYGERDFMAPDLMIPLIKQVLQKTENCDFTLLAMPDLNHSFQTCKTGSLTEYATVTETIAPSVLEVIGDWIILHTS